MSDEVSKCSRCNSELDLSRVPADEIDHPLVCVDCDLREKLTKDQDDYRKYREELRLASAKGDTFSIQRIEGRMAHLEAEFRIKNIDPNDL